MVSHNPADLVYSAFSQPFFQAMVKMLKNDSVVENIVMTDKERV